MHAAVHTLEVAYTPHMQATVVLLLALFYALHGTFSFLPACSCPGPGSRSIATGQLGLAIDS